MLQIHARRSRTGAFAASIIACSVLTLSLIYLAYRKQHRPAAALDMMSVVSVESRPAAVNSSSPDMAWRDQKSGKIHHLSDFRGKPIVLCFGSATCGPFRTSIGIIEQIYRQNHGQVLCLLVYTKEAHPELGQAAYMRDSHTWADRATASCDLKQDIKLTMPIAIDTLDNRAASAFEARPSRIYVLDRKGKIVFGSSEYPASDMAFGAAGTVNKMMASASLQ